MCLRLATVQSSVSPVTLESRCSKHDQYLDLPHSLFDPFERLDNGLINSLANSRDSRSTLCRSVEPLLDEFCVFVDENDIPGDAPVPSSTD